MAAKPDKPKEHKPDNGTALLEGGQTKCSSLKERHTSDCLFHSRSQSRASFHATPIRELAILRAMPWRSTGGAHV